MKLHRNSPKRIIRRDATYFVTTNTKHWYPYFRNKIMCELFVRQLKLCKSIKGFRLYAFVITYDHVHLLLQPNNTLNISQVMFSIKKQFAHNANKMIDVYGLQSNNITNPTVAGGQSLARRIPFEIRQNEIHESTNHLHDMNAFIIKHQNHHSFKRMPKFQWHPCYFDRMIRNQHEFDVRFNYIGKNPYKHRTKSGNPIDWKYVYPNICGNDFDGLVDIYTY